MSGSALRFLQQENIRQKKTIASLEQDIKAMSRYLDMITELYWISQHINNEKNPAETINYLLRSVGMAIGSNDGSISRLNRETDELKFIFVHGDLKEQLAGFRMKSDTGIAGWVVTHQEPIIINNPRQDWRFSQIVDEEFGFLTQSIASVPIMDRNTVLGVIQLVNKTGNHFTDADVAVLLIFGHIASIVLDKIEIEEKDKAEPIDFFFT